jgi:hypothetical protein
MTLTFVIIAAFIFGCCAIPGFARRLWKFVWKLGAAVFVLVALLLVAAWITNIRDGMIHPPGSDAEHAIKLELSQLGNPPEGKFWTYKDAAGHEWKEENGAWWVWYNGAWTKSKYVPYDFAGFEPDRPAVARFTIWYFALHPEEKLPKDHTGGWRPPEAELDIEYTAVDFALHPRAIDIPETGEWLLTEIERIKAYARSRRLTLRQVVWEEYAKDPAAKP